MAARRSARAVLTVLGLALSATGCSGAGGSSGEDGAQPVTVIMVNNPQMEDLERLTAEFFTAETGIEVDFTLLPENDVRDAIQTEFSSQSGQYDIASISNVEVPTFSQNQWIANLDAYVEADEGYDQDDIVPGIADGLRGQDGSLYAAPFYGESSWMMYRTDVFAEKGLTMPANPTWQQIAELAAQADGARPGMRGICLRGLPGWGAIGGALTTVVNTFGGTWYDIDWNAQVNAPEFTEAVQFYVDLARTHGQADSANSNYIECLNNFQQGGTAMWYDSTSALPEAEGSPIAGLVGYAQAPVVLTDASGWLYSWAWGIQEASDNKDAAWEFISWASSAEYERLVGEEISWVNVPSGKRTSTYEIPEFQEANPSYEVAREALSSVDPNNPGVQPRPAPGAMFVAIPEYPAMATEVTRGISSAIAGQTTVEEALARGQELAQAVGDEYKQ